MSAGSRVGVLPGEGIVARFGAVVAVIADPAHPEVPPLLALLEQLAALEPLDPAPFSRALLAWVARSRDGELPAIGVVAPVGEDLVVLLHGAMQCRVDGPEAATTLRGRDAPVSLNVVVAGPMRRATVEAEGAEPAEALPYTHLAGGVVPGGAVSLLREAADGEATGEVATAPADPLDDETTNEVTTAPAAPHDDETTSELPTGRPQPVRRWSPTPSGPSAEQDPSPAEQEPPSAEQEPPPEPGPTLREPRPTLREPGAAVRQPGAAVREDGEPDLVPGIECPDGHFNHPYALQCSTCGRSLLDDPRRTVFGTRQTLGTITFEDGATHDLDRDYVLGREPEDDPAVRAGRALPLRLDDPDKLISRVHAEVALVGWEVQVRDRGSANGTYVLAPESNDWQRLPVEEPWTISPGSRVAIGRKVLTYES